MTLTTDVQPVGPVEVAGGQRVACAQESYPARSQAWFVVSALALTNMMSYVERQIPTLMFAPIKHDFHLSDTQVSLLAGFAFVLFYVGCGLFVGRLADHANRKRIITVGIVLWSMATISVRHGAKLRAPVRRPHDGGRG